MTLKQNLRPLDDPLEIADSYRFSEISDPDNLTNYQPRAVKAFKPPNFFAYDAIVFTDVSQILAFMALPSVSDEMRGFLADVGCRLLREKYTKNFESIPASTFVEYWNNNPGGYRAFGVKQQELFRKKNGEKVNSAPSNTEIPKTTKKRKNKKGKKKKIEDEEEVKIEKVEEMKIVEEEMEVEEEKKDLDEESVDVKVARRLEEMRIAEEELNAVNVRGSFRASISARTAQQPKSSDTMQYDDAASGDDMTNAMVNIKKDAALSDVNSAVPYKYQYSRRLDERITRIAKQMEEMRLESEMRYKQQQVFLVEKLGAPRPKKKPGQTSHGKSAKYLERCRLWREKNRFNSHGFGPAGQAI